ncbi:ectoine/hydroxyectoine ABC transporter permease subunit EhuC [Bradyrhizobium canariense]|uniref:Ectoine/hydroxyectoine ABC transporter permease subunit EhuC n=1 Tax=Bradyrhizobium canariense TaxID=255045 RepID=A0A1X3HBP1_9BRAD|nr:ectoine/hydroxyectoine ABC transporter permease subunit EhuC [Bradyrhizobium canariense]OSI73179.1 ectoine/hydroxyectoine ABC transporter permease subunit EhuC [Bradyrhizobium canariense]OSI81281.1 ectoine/hydroxyectoine ABC transporter permease subunit EhuC [Bradyrhizobium canariense]OSI94556.1 ectoine/hydroxyectoine ABC transporter permease subunit EhuC [Bradyrhizobium canariense]OSI95144.1 ectoine/hydroxyectoine ABC transporter permease subunit EhuC [Bradyrhizobium canariense]OSJ08189.1 
MPQSSPFLPTILSGAVLTIELTLLGNLLAVAVAFVVGFARLMRAPWVRFPALLFTEFFRGTSMFVQLFWAYFVLPLSGISLSPFQAAVLVLGLNSGAYASEIVRGAMLALPREQIEACVALNLGRWQRLRYVLLPQALLLMIAPFSNSAVELLKSTSIVSLISLSEMAFRAQTVRTQTGETAIPYLTILVIYFALAMVISTLMRLLEQRLSPGTTSVQTSQESGRLSRISAYFGYPLRRRWLSRR